MVGKPIFARKEDANAREALKLYESKQYKKALRLVDQNLKKSPHHPESLALKGCCNHFLGHKSEAEPYILRALEKDPSNYLVNHLAGIYYRTVENYQAAAKWYKAAVDHGSQNTALYRDLAMLQTQIRDYRNLKDSRQKYLEGQPGYRANWTSVAVAHHLNKDYDAAVNTLTKIEGIIKEHLQEQDRYEQSECVLYKNLIIAEAGDYGRALTELEADSDEIRDRTAFLEYKAKYLMLLGKSKEASVVYRQLLLRNPDDMGYYHMLEASLGTPAMDVEIRLLLYDKLARFYPRADPPVFLPLTFLPASHPEFRSRAEAYILVQLKRGVPATFVNVKPLYKNKEKAEIIGRLALAFLNDQVPSLPPTVNVWTQFFLAQHFLHLKNLDDALKYVDSAIDHSPTLVELYMLKARIVKNQGDVQEASRIMLEARVLDLQDRYINTKATKYLFRANKVDEAVDCVSLFMKLDDKAVNGLKDLHVMQANWTIVEGAEAYSRLYKYEKAKLGQLTPESEEYLSQLDTCDLYRGLALKRFQAVINVFKIYYGDQFDFHSYCMRKGTPRDYIDTLKWEDKLHATPIFIRAVRGLSELYWEIHELNKIEKSQDDKTSRKQKARKPKNIKRRAELIERVESVKEDADPLGAKILSDLTEDTVLMAELQEFVKKLTTEADQTAFTWDLAYKVYKEESKYVLALQAIRNWAKIVGGGNPKSELVAARVLDLRKTLEEDTESNRAIIKVAQKGLESAFPDVQVA